MHTVIHVLILFLLSTPLTAQKNKCSVQRDSISKLIYRDNGFFKTNYNLEKKIQNYKSCILQMDSNEIMKDLFKYQSNEYWNMQRTSKNVYIGQHIQSSCCGYFHLEIFFDVKTRKPKTVKIQKSNYKMIVRKRSTPCHIIKKK